MSRQSLVRTPAVVALVALLVAGAGSIQRIREASYPDVAAVEDTLYLTSGATLRRLTAGYNALAADLYWIRAIQYFGGAKVALANAVPGGAPPVAPPTDYRLLYPLLDITTTLDPKFNIAYRFGAVFLAEALPAGAGRPDLAIALLEKGLGAVPDKWEYMQDIGFVHYWWRHDYQAAAAWFARAADVPKAPWFLKSLAATTLAEGGDRASSRIMWQAIHESAEIEWLRNDSERRLTQLRAMDEIDELQRQFDRFTAATGRQASDWSEVVGAIPVDPMQTPYELDAGRVRLSRSSPLFPLPDEPQRMVTPTS